MIEINTENYVKPKNILIDGKSWTMTAPGAGDEMALSQATRRIQQIENKIKSSTATDSDYDLYDAMEAKIYNLFQKIFRDTTEDNSEVKSWLENTPMSVVEAVIKEVKRQSEEDGKPEIPTN